MFLIIIYKRFIQMNATNIKYLDFVFYGCSSLSDLSGISEWNVNNLISMKYIFSKCNNLKQKPDISNWKKGDLKMTNEMTIIYNIENERKIRLFGNKFVGDNNNKCNLLINNKLEKLKEFYENINKEKSIKIILRK